MYAKVLGNEVLKYPYTFQDLEEENPYTNFDDGSNIVDCYNGTEDQIASNAKVVLVMDVISPSYDPHTQKSTRYLKPELQGDEWIMSYNIEALSSDEIDSEIVQIESDIRNKITSALGLTDWTVAEDTSLPPDKVKEWERYRASLSDVPNQAGFPFNVVYPVKPT